MSTITLTLKDFEIAVLVACLAFAAWGPRLGRRRRTPLPGWKRLPGSPCWAIALAAASGFAVSAMVSLSYPVEPRFHDEFSYLLGADTFASGRLTNPTPALSEHFETFHVIQTPSYQSKYPPGQALVLAAGQALTGAPIVGVWLGVGLACAGLCWMLVAFVPARWALLGALLPLLRFGIFENNALFSYWLRSYWGGALAMLGGALVWGGMRRLVRGPPRVRDALLFALGGSVLLSTRPLEGAIASLPAILVLVVWLGRQRGPALRAAWVHGALPSALLFGAALVATGFYHAQVTGDWLRAPYQVYEARYSGGVAGFFSADAATAAARAEVGNELMRSTYQTLLETRQTHMDTAGKILAHSVERLQMVGRFLLGPLLLLPMLLNGAVVLRNPWVALAAGTCALVAIEVAVLDYVFPHYFAPIAPLLVLWAIQSLRSWQGFRWRGRRVGATAVRASLLLALLMFVLAVGQFAYRAHHGAPHWNQRRAQIVERLESRPGRHLVLVVYGQERPNEEAEWVYNRADLESSRIVWARALGAERDRRLREHFADRSAWLALVDERPIELKRLAPLAP